MTCANVNRADSFNYPRDELLDNCDYLHEPEVDHCPVISVKFFNFIFPCLIDSGSEICCISGIVWSQLQDFHGKIAFFPCVNVRVTGAFKSKQKKLSIQANIPFTINNRQFMHEFMVIDELIYPVIIGIDFLRRRRAKINLELHEITFVNQDGFEVKVPELTNVKHVTESMESLEIRAVRATVDPMWSISVRSISAVEIPLDFDEVVNASSLSHEEITILKQLLEKNADIFSELPGLTNDYYHEIKLKEKCDGFFIKPYPLPVAHRKVVQEAIINMENLGIIERAATPFVSPLMTTLKKDGTVRICLDSRKLNAMTERDYENPKPIEEIMLTFQGAKYLSSLDLTHGYFQIPLSPDSKKYTGFSFGNKTYQFRVLPFGLCNAVASFSRAIDTILGPEFSDFVITYIDDLLVISNTFEEHLDHLQKIFSRLKSAGLTLKLRKCSFFKKEIKFLGYIFNQEGIKPDESRIQAIVEYKKPHDVKSLQRFLGLCNFDRVFCPNLSNLTEPLTYLLKKKVKFCWTERQDQAFYDVKRALSNATLLYHPNLNETFHVSTDASNVGLGAQLFQIIAGDKRVVAWASRTLLERERRYSSNELEVLGVVFALQRWRIYLLGRSFVIHTDNKAITYINTCRLLSPRISRWALALNEFDFVVEHVPAGENQIADALSRHTTDRLATPTDKIFQINSVLRLDSDFVKLLKNIRVYQRQDPKLTKIIEQLESDESLDKKFSLINDILYLHPSDEEYLLCVPTEIKKNFIIAYHVALGHFGSYKCWYALRSEVWWSNMYRDIKRTLKECDLCQRTKFNALPKPPLHPIMVKNKGEIVALDLYGPLPRSRGGTCYILVVLDLFTKHVALYPLRRATTRACLNKLTLDYFGNFGIPQSILSDRGTQFSSPVWKRTLENMNIRVVYTSIRHPEANPSERIMKELGRLFRAYCHAKHTRWAWEVPKFVNFLNNTVHETTGFTANELHFGQPKIKLLPDKLQSPSAPTFTYSHKLMLARENFENRAARRAARRPFFPYMNFELGDLVLLKANRMSSAVNAETKKFLLLYEGPYKVKRKVSFDTYLLESPDTRVERGTFHASHIKKYYEPP